MEPFSYWQSEEIRSYFVPKAPNERLTDLLRERSALLEGVRTVLDMGCGFGRNLLPFATGREVFACDPCVGALAHTRARFGLDDAHVRASTLEDEPWRGERTFDLVVCDGVLHQCLGREAVARAAAFLSEVISPGGFLFLSVFTSDCLPTGAVHEGGGVWRTEEGMRMTLPKAVEVLAVLRDVGLAPVDSWCDRFSLGVGERSNLTCLCRKGEDEQGLLD